MEYGLHLWCGLPLWSWFWPATSAGDFWMEEVGLVPRRSVTVTWWIQWILWFSQCLGGWTSWTSIGRLAASFAKKKKVTPMWLCPSQMLWECSAMIDHEVLCVLLNVLWAFVCPRFLNYAFNERRQPFPSPIPMKQSTKWRIVKGDSICGTTNTEVFLPMWGDGHAPMHRAFHAQHMKSQWEWTACIDIVCKYIIIYTV